jgi:hypothetical protein
MNRNIGEDESAADVLTELTSRAEIWAGQAGAFDSGPLRTQVEQALERPVRAGEPVHTVLEEIVGKLTSVLKARDVDKAALTPAGGEHAVPAPDAPVGPARTQEEAAEARTQSELHAAVESVLARKIEPGEQPPEILAELAARLQPAIESVGVRYPALLSNLLSKIPGDFRWLATLLVPLVLGGGSGFMIPSSYKQQYVQAQDELKQNQDKQSKLIGDLAAKTAEISDLGKDNVRLRDLNAQMTALDGQLEQSNQKTSELQNNLVAARGMVSSLRPFADRGFVRWQGEGGGDLQFLPSPTRVGNPKPGNIVEGKFPDRFAGRHCVIVEVVGDVDRAEGLRDKPCSQMIKIKGKTNDRQSKQALIVWRVGSGN